MYSSKHCTADTLYPNRQRSNTRSGAGFDHGFPQGQDLPLYNIFLGVYPSLSPLRSIEFYSIWLENGSDHLDIQGRIYREGCAEEESRLDRALGWKGASRVPKRSTKLLFQGKRLVCFSEKSLFIDVFHGVWHRFSITVAWRRVHF